MRLGRALLFLGIFLCTAGFDQATKHWAETSLSRGSPQPFVDGYWDWELAKNTGVAFSTFAGIEGGQIVLSLLAIVFLIAIGVMAARTKPGENWKLVGLALIGGGALGNLIDRVRAGGVTDFVRWKVGDWAWPIFNLADVALVLGLCVLVLESVLAKKRRAMIRP
jgi:signal peptidase II